MIATMFLGIMSSGLGMLTLLILMKI